MVLVLGAGTEQKAHPYLIKKWNEIEEKREENKMQNELIFDGAIGFPRAMAPVLGVGDENYWLKRLPM